MVAISLREFERIERKKLGATVCRQLQRFDEDYSKKGGDTVFDWSRVATVGAKNWVGVIQIPGAQIEILPKTDVGDAGARKNLLYMLGVCQRLPIRERDLASLDLKKRPILEILIGIFIDKLLCELRRGVHHRYLLREENCGFVRGKIVLPIHITKNAAHQERVYVAYDEFQVNTPLSQILKRACRVLLGQSRRPDLQRSLREAILVLADVDDVQVRQQHFDQVRLGRDSERFSHVLDFARIVLLEGSPALNRGGTRTFSVLAPMDQLFEEFIARLLRRNARSFGLAAHEVHVQAKGLQRYLLRSESNGLRYKLKPDILIVDAEGKPRLIIDTKWKRLGNHGAKLKRASEDDVYQLYAYANRYDCADNILLFPKAPGAPPERYTLEADPMLRRLRIEFVDMSRDLLGDRAQFLAEIRYILNLSKHSAALAG